MPQPGWDVRRFATLPSTNTYLLGEARAGAQAGTVAVADHQTAGRGRMGRRWEAPPGRCLLASVLLRPLAPPGSLFACTAAVALAAVDACAAVAGVEPGIKWPNDLVIDERKVGGVLAEADSAAPGGRPGTVAVVVGVGCNVDWPGPAEAHATSLAEHATHPVDRDALLESLLVALAPRVEQLDNPEGRHAIVADVRRRCVTLGRHVLVDAGNVTVAGRASRLDDDGHLVVATSAGEVVEVAAGDVVHVRPVDCGDLGLG